MQSDRELLELAAKAVSYNQVTGAMVWLPKPAEAPDSARWNARYAGKPCGTPDGKGYHRILIRPPGGGVFRIRLHQLAWFIVSGKKQVGEIDHINQDKSDNRIANLRDVSKSVNQRNGTRKGNNTSGFPGVTWHKQRSKWCAQASIDGKHRHIGFFESPEAAHEAATAFRLAHGFTPTHGRAIIRAAASLAQAAQGEMG